MRGQRADLEMQMRSAGMAGGADGANHISLAYALATAHVDRAQVGIQRLEVIAVIHHNHIAITVVIPPGVDDHTCICGVDCFPFISGDVDTPVVRAG